MWNIITNSQIEHLKKLCIAYNVDKMYLFGSALNSNFNEKSDIDFLVKFKTIELYGYFENYMNFKEKLKTLFGREVDLLEEQTLQNPILIRSINKSKELVYG
ncbi:MAG: nucleotidyltransferase family protein [Bacteroidia bacterium]